MSIIIHDVFVESVFETSYDHVDNKKILEYIDFLRDRNEEGVKLSNIGGWQYHVKENEHDEIEKLKEALLDSAHSILKDCYEYDIKNLQIGNIWMNVNEYGNYNMHHTHVGSIFSCVYYLQVPDKGYESLMFDSNDFYQRQVQSHMVTDHPDNRSNDCNNRTRYAAYFAPEDNKAFFFNPSLQHSVQRHENKEIPRISIAANFIIA